MYHLKGKLGKENQAFTLIEVMVALFIFVIITAIISASLMQVLSNVKTVRIKQERLMDIQTVLATMQFDLSQIIVKPEISETGIAPGSFYTRENSLHFFKMGNVNPAFQLKRSSIEEVIYRIEEGNLIRLSKSSDENNYFRQIVLNDVQDLQWQFLDPKGAQYAIWPPTQDWAYKIPVITIGLLTLADYGVITITAEASNYEINQ